MGEGLPVSDEASPVGAHPTTYDPCWDNSLESGHYFGGDDCFSGDKLLGHGGDYGLRGDHFRGD